MKKYGITLAVVCFFDGIAGDFKNEPYSKIVSAGESIITKQPQNKPLEDSSICLACIVATSKKEIFSCPQKSCKRCLLWTSVGGIISGECLIVTANIVL